MYGSALRDCCRYRRRGVCRVLGVGCGSGVGGWLWVVRCHVEIVLAYLESKADIERLANS